MRIVDYMTNFTFNEKAIVPVNGDQLDEVCKGAFYNPHEILGAHLGSPDFPDTCTIRVLRPGAQQVTIITADGEFEARPEHNGVFVALVPAPATKDGHTVPDYRIRTVRADGTTATEADPYRYLPTIGDMDLYLFGEGRHERLWEVMGAHVRRYDDPLGGNDGTKGEQVVGTSFTVWAPNAHAVQVVGDFNAWDGTCHAMRELGSSGVWELFVPGVQSGEIYKFHILNAYNNWEMKADPMERSHEVPPRTGSIVVESTHDWQDGAWMERRASSDPHQGPVSIYEVHANSWRKDVHNYRELADKLVPYVEKLGFTHVEFMPLEEYPFSGSWGYQVTGYYGVDSRLGGPDDFKYLVDRFHEAGIGVIMDWVPAHFPKDAFALGRFDGTPLYEDPDPTRGEHPDWGTYIFNFGRREVRNFLVADACFWLDEYHMDGLRVDAVSSMLYLDYSRQPGQWHPNKFGGRENLEAIDFIKEANATAYKNNPGIMMIAEESTAYPGVTAPTDQGGLGYGLKWNMGWMHDTLEYLHEQPINRKWHHNEITFSMVYAYSEHYVLPTATPSPTTASAPCAPTARPRPRPIHTDICPQSATWTSTCSARAAMNAYGRSWAPMCAAMTIRSEATTARRASKSSARRSPSGRRTRTPCRSSATSTHGMAHAMRCANSAPQASGSSSSRASSPVRSTSSISSTPTTTGR